jgi:diguanylate cyclase (GGDEF)-like protein
MTPTDREVYTKFYLNHSLRGIGSNEIDWVHWQSIVDTISSIFEAPVAVITQANIKGIEIMSASSPPHNPHQAGQSLSAETNIYCNKVIRTGQPLHVKDGRLDPQWHDNPELIHDKFVSYYGLPIFWPNGNPFGTLCVMDTNVRCYSPELIKLLTVFRDTINADLKHFYIKNQLLTENYTDKLTRIYNRRGFSNIFFKHRELAVRLNQTLMLIYFDINQFKPINDTYGHAIGDAVLMDFSDRLRQNCRSCDFIARWGGDEFLMLAQIQTYLQLTSFIERLQHESDIDNLPSYNFSHGHVLISPDSTDSFEELIVLADKKMYLNKQQAKKEKRNKTQIN